MKAKLKKLGVLAVVLLAGTFSQVGNAQETIHEAFDSPSLGSNGTDTRSEYVILKMPFSPPTYVCFYCGSDCIVVSCTNK